MDFAAWSTFAGVLLVGMALSTTLLGRLPVSSSMLYLAIGVAASPLWLGWTSMNPVAMPLLLERLAEVVVVVSLFTSGLKMGIGLRDGRWRLPVRLALLSMLVTVALVAMAAHLLLGLPIGAAILLGGVLAPTDPVLASEVQVTHAGDRDRLRFSLTGEAGMNDGTAFPVIMLGLGLMGLHDIGAYGWRWFAVDVVWAVAVGLATGAAVGWAVGKLVLYLRRVHHEAVGLDEFLALGTIALSYGLALQWAGYGFLAVFAAGVMLRQIERHESAQSRVADDTKNGDPDGPAQQAAIEATRAARQDDKATDPIGEVAVDASHAPAFMAHAMQRFTQQLESIGEVVAVLVVGMLMWTVDWRMELFGFIAFALLVARPLAVLAGLAGSRSGKMQRGLIAWFGIRGIGSLYYLMYAVNHGLASGVAEDLATISLAVIAVSIVVHGLSVTPLIALYDREGRGRRER